MAVVDKSQIDSLLRETMVVRATTGKVLEEYYKGYKNYSPRYLQDLAASSNVTGVNSPVLASTPKKRDLCPMALDYFDEKPLVNKLPSPKLSPRTNAKSVYHDSLLSAGTFNRKMRDEHTFSKIIPSYD